MAGSINELTQELLEALVNGDVNSGVAGFTNIGGVVALNVFTRPAATASVVSLTNATAVSNGSTYDCGYVAFATVVQITSSAALTAGQIKIQGSLDGTTWADMKTIDATADFPSAVSKIYSFDTTNTAKVWRVAITTTLTGGNVTARIRSS
jgi:hypothetical protein